MNLEQVAQFVKNPEMLTLSHAESLKSLAQKHPYTAIYPLLYLTALSNGKSTELEEALKQFAYRIPDRTRLYHLLTGTGRVEHVEAGAAEEIKAVESVSTDKEVEGVETISQTIAAPSEREEKSAVQGFTPEETLAKELAIPEEPEVERKTEAEIGFDFDKVTTAHSLEQYIELDAPGVAEEPLLETESAIELETGAVPVVEDPASSQPQESSMKPFTSWLKSSGAVPVKSTGTIAKSTATDLIDKFIKEEPTISRNKSEFFSPSKKAKESLNEAIVPVSETLAKIYAAQGNYPKAIHVYHQLMLSIPEKKSFFAIQIEELKKKITS